MTGPLMTSFSWNFQVIAAPILAGLDKFFNILVNWEKYLAPFVGNLIAPGLFMAVVGVVEIAAGIGVAIKPRIYAYVVAAWLVGIILNLLILPGYFDVALRDLGLALGALALGRLSQKYDGPWMLGYWGAVRHKHWILEKFESRWPYIIQRIFPDESETRGSRVSPSASLEPQAANGFVYRRPSPCVAACADLLSPRIETYLQFRYLSAFPHTRLA
jgi:hypothetical protein